MIKFSQAALDKMASALEDKLFRGVPMPDHWQLKLTQPKSLTDYQEAAARDGAMEGLRQALKHAPMKPVPKSVSVNFPPGALASWPGTAHYEVVVRASDFPTTPQKGQTMPSFTVKEAVRQVLLLTHRLEGAHSTDKTLVKKTANGMRSLLYKILEDKVAPEPTPNGVETIAEWFQRAAKVEAAQRNEQIERAAVATGDYAHMQKKVDALSSALGQLRAENEKLRAGGSALEVSQAALFVMLKRYGSANVTLEEAMQLAVQIGEKVASRTPINFSEL